MIRFFDLKEKSKDLLIRTGALVSAGVVLFTMSSCSKKAEPSVEEPTSYNVVMDEITKDDDTCVLFNVGNFTTKGVSNIKKIKKANKKDITSGVIINTSANSKGEILKDAEYAKYLIENADIDYPVYLDVEGLINNPKLRVDEMLELISAFCSKLSSNGVFVGVCGKEKTIQILIKHDNNEILSAYDVLLLDNQPDIELDVDTMIETDEDNKMSTKNNIKKIIDDKGLNKKEAFVYDSLYYLKDGETLFDVAFAFNLSVEDLLIYNDIDEKDIDSVKGPIRIPTKLNGCAIIEDTENEPMLGFDIFSGEEAAKADWDKFLDKADFVIMKANQGSNVDEKFEYFSTKFAENKKPIGAYCYNHYIESYIPMDEFKKSVERQARTYITAIQGKSLSFPAYLDIENKDYLKPAVKLDLTTEQVTFLLDNWYDTMTKSDYIPGLYCSKSIYQYLINHYDGDISKFKIWISGDIKHFNDYGIYYNSGVTTPEMVEDSLSNVEPEDMNTSYQGEEIFPEVIQITERGREFGLGNSAGYIDVDVTFKDYVLSYASSENILTEEELELLKTIEPEQFTAAWNEFRGFVETEEFGYGTIYGMSTTVILACLIRRIIENFRRRRSAARTRERQNENTQ